MFLLILPTIIAESPLTAASIACRGCRRGSPSTVAAHRRSSPPRLAASVRPYSWLIFSFSSCHFSPCCSAARDAARVRVPRACTFLARRRARSLRGAVSRARLPCASIPCAVQNRAGMNGSLAFPAGPGPRHAEYARAARSLRSAFAFPAVPF